MLNLEGGHIACDRIVEDDIVNGHVLASIFDMLRFTKAENQLVWFKKRRFERLNLEGGNVACRCIVEDDIVNGHILTSVFNG